LKHSKRTEAFFKKSPGRRTSPALTNGMRASEHWKKRLSEPKNNSLVITSFNKQRKDLARVSLQKKD